jgi:gliding motility-associated-like protein
VKPVNCEGGNDGEVQIFVLSGGSGSYEYSREGGTYQDDPASLLTNLAPGTYNFTLRDKITGCSAPTQVTVTTRVIIAGLIIASPANTCGGTGSIEFRNISGSGLAPYRVSIDGGTTYLEWPAGRLFPNLNPATYPVAIRDANGCTYNTPIEITGIPSVSMTAAASSQPGSCSTADGEITLTVTGGTAPFEYSVNNGPFAANASGKIGRLAPGDYVITVKDASGCEATATLSLAVDPINLTVDAGEATCENPTATVKAVLPATDDVTRYRFSINGSAFQASPEFRNVAPGIYTMHVRLGNGTAACPATKEFVVNGVSAISYRVSQANIGCEGGEKGSITVSDITGGTTSNSRTANGISIDNGVSFRYTGSNTITFTDLAPGSYKVVLEYGNGCRTPAQEVLISSGGIPFTVKTTPSTCGSPNGTAEAEILNNTAGKRYFYSINNTNFFETALFVNLQPGEYRMYIRENASDVCANILPFLIPGPDSVKFDMQRQGCNNLVLTNIRGGQPPYRVSIDGGNTFVSGNLFTSSFTVSNLRDGDYVVVIADNQNCRTFPANVRIGNTLTARIRATLSMADEPTGEIQVLDIRGGNGPYEVSLNGTEWSLVKDNSIPYDTTIRNQPIGLYNVYIRDANGCMKVYNTEVKESRFLIPNIFTPNGDGVNDTFFIRNLPPSTIVKIVNRWGKVVFETANYQNDWKGGDYPDGVYFYTVNIAGGGTSTGWVQIWR